MKNRITKILAVACVFTVLIGSFAFFTDRLTAVTNATAGNIDLQWYDTSENLEATAPDNSNNEFAIDKVWDNAKLVSDGKIINPGDFFDLSYNLDNDGNKSIRVRQRLVLTSSVPMTDGTEEYQLTAITVDGADAIQAKVAATADGKTTYTYDLKDIVLDGTTEAETGASNGEYTVRLDFSEAAKNAFMDSTVKVDLYAAAVQFRNTDANDLPAYTDLPQIMSTGTWETIDDTLYAGGAYVPPVSP